MAKKKRGRWDNLTKSKNLKLRQDYMDVHFLNGVKSITGNGEGIRALTEEEKDWLNEFYGEYYNASVNHRSYDEQLHDNQEMVKDCYDRNNARNRCLLNKGKAINTVEFRNWGEFDQKTIDDDIEYEEETSIKFFEHTEKEKLYKRIEKNYPGLFEYDEFMSYDIHMIFEKIRNLT